MTLVKIIVLSAFGFSMSAHAMGELERTLNWKFNWDSEGTYMAELENQREIILQQYNNEFLNEKNKMEGEKKTRIVAFLKESIVQLDRLIVSEQNLADACQTGRAGLDEVVGAVQAFQLNNVNQSLKIQELAQTFRQEADLNGMDPANVAELAEICDQYENTAKHSAPVCRLIKLFNTRDDAALTEITPDQIHAQIDALAKHEADQARLCQKISMQISIFQAKRNAIAARLQFLDGKK
jgi:hypothetical protein